MRAEKHACVRAYMRACTTADTFFLSSFRSSFLFFFILFFSSSAFRYMNEQHVSRLYASTLLRETRRLSLDSFCSHLQTTATTRAWDIFIYASTSTRENKGRVYILHAFGDTQRKYSCMCTYMYVYTHTHTQITHYTRLNSRTKMRKGWGIVSYSIKVKLYYTYI